jgi:glycerol-3-phosphate acyltransferase PlsY
MIPAVAITIGFLLGSIPFGVVVARLRGVDLRKVGSGNIGATNAARALGRKLGLLVLLLDTAKAYLPVVAVRHLGVGDARTAWVAAAVGLAAFLGHCFSPWLRLRGGKGVASGLGVFLALAPMSAAIAAAVWVGVYAVTRISSVGSLVGTTVLIPVMALRHEPRAHLALAAALYIVILWKHRDNIRRLLQKKETKV